MGDLIDFAKYLEEKKVKEAQVPEISDEAINEMIAALVYQDTLNETLLLFEDLHLDMEETEKYVQAVAFMASLVVSKLNKEDREELVYLDTIVEHLEENPCELVVITDNHAENDS